MTGQTPCTIKEDVTVFSEDFYTEVDLTLTKDGRISVFVHGNEEGNGFMLTCRVCYKFHPEAITVRLGYNKQKGNGD
uniref:Uncharacterized protein n=1 Tax=Megaselia scalaris TaxID=36166 RepID=T1GE14_MEGSC